MKLKTFLKLVSLLFAGKAIFGVFYILLNWQVAIAGWIIPTWLIVIAVVVDSYLSYTACKLSK